MSAREGCAEVHELAPELALGITTGEERARALAHLARCAACRQHLDELSDVADELLLLTPSREPPLGFESRVVDRLRARRAPRRPWTRAVMAAAAAAVIAAAAAGGAVLVATAPDRELASSYRDTLETADGEYFHAAPLRARGGAEAGHVFAYQGSPSWVFVTVADPGRAGRYRVELVAKDRTRTLGRLRVRDGLGGWGGIVPVELRDVYSIRLVGEDQRLVARL